MKVWNVTNEPTPELTARGLSGVSIQVGDVTLKPGESTMVLPHIRGEIQSHINSGALSTTPPKQPEPAPGVPEQFPLNAPPPFVEAPAEAPAETSADEQQGRRRRS